MFFRLGHYLLWQEEIFLSVIQRSTLKYSHLEGSLGALKIERSTWCLGDLKREL